MGILLHVTENTITSSSADFAYKFLLGFKSPRIVESS